MSYYISKTLHTDFDTAVTKTKDALQHESFGIITEIDLHETFKKKLDIEFRNYKILGACNPPFAYMALQTEDKIGTMLPCNVIVQDLGHHKIEIAAIDPLASMEAVKNDEIKKIAEQIKVKLENVISSLE